MLLASPADEQARRNGKLIASKLATMSYDPRKYLKLRIRAEVERRTNSGQICQDEGGPS
ncbi:hypothetical protein [Paracoccus ravus]|uniref:hypothetical protein n=1 Tax=Paracoccus ravus TaxID=2447760 RepID=UPI00143188E8|nr:hypothetical protein [Paracoccus ravus]